MNDIMTFIVRWIVWRLQLVACATKPLRPVVTGQWSVVRGRHRAVDCVVMPTLMTAFWLRDSLHLPANKLSPRGDAETICPRPRRQFDVGKNRGRVRSPHICGGYAAGSQRACSLGSCAMGQTDGSRNRVMPPRAARLLSRLRSRSWINHWSLTHGQCDARPTVTFPVAGHHRPLTGAKLYCLVTEARVCEQLAQGC